MEFAFKTRKLGKIFNSRAMLQKAYGASRAKAIMRRMSVLGAAHNLEEVPTTPPERRHQLLANRDEQFAVDLVHPYRLLFKPNHDPVPRKDDGGIDTRRVTAIKILEVVDYY